MDDRLTFRNKLAECLAKRREWLEHAHLPQLKSEFRVFQTAYAGLYAVLIKKGLLHEDPYKGDLKVGEIRLPDQHDFAENERLEQMSIRLSQLDSQLGFLLSYYDFSVDFISLERIKSLLGIIKFINWSQLSIASADCNTKAVADLCAALRAGNDAFTAGLVSDALNHLDKSSKIIFRLMKDLSDFKRETYKFDIRVRFHDILEAGGAAADTTKRLKRSFAEHLSGQPFYLELVDEIFKEDASAGGQMLRDALIGRLAVNEDKARNAMAAVSFKSILLDGLRSLGLVSFPLDDAFRKLAANSAVLEDERDGIADRLQRFVRKMFKMKPKALIYEVEFFDPVKAASQTEKVNFLAFQTTLEREIRFLSSLNNRSSTVIKRFEEAPEELLLGALTKTLDEIKNMHKTMSGLDLFFKSEASRELRTKIRGIQPELSSIKNAVVKGNQKRHDYVARKEEQEQMKRLGIRGETM